MAASIGWDFQLGDRRNDAVFKFLQPPVQFPESGLLSTETDLDRFHSAVFVVRGPLGTEFRGELFQGRQHRRDILFPDGPESGKVALRVCSEQTAPQQQFRPDQAAGGSRIRQFGQA